jgi:Reverse transcriptase (RNA-dependent DNA polymerase)
VEEAVLLDRESGNHLWEEAIRKEMLKAHIAYDVNKYGYTPDDIRNGRAPLMIGYQEIQCHLVFDVKMDFCRKVRFVAGGHMTEAPASMTYASVVSRDSVRLGFLIAKLNELGLLSCDIGNAYLNALCQEKIWFQAGKECGSDEGKAMVLCRALYSLKSVGASWRAMFSGSIKDLGFNSTMIDPDVYIRKNFRNDSTPYYEMILVYVDDVLCISSEPKGVMEALGELYELKDGSVCEPTLFRRFSWQMEENHGACRAINM